ncbi:MAG: hypothetical protein ACM34K_19055 [Bacillota bacterium]
MKIISFIFIFLTLITLGCQKEKESMIIKTDVYYVLKDSFFGEPQKCRVCFQIPLADTLANDSSATICMSLKNDTLTYSRLFNGKIVKDEYLLKVVNVQKVGKDSVIVAPIFSPVTVSQNDLQNLKYEKGKAKVLNIKVKATRGNMLEFLSAHLANTKNKEPLRIK